MPDTLVYIGYAVTVIVVVALSFKLGKYVDIIDAKSKISGAFIGGVMLAAVTSLPELFTSLSSVWIVRESSLVIGNILGSDLINLAFFGVILLVFTRGMRKAKFSKYYITSLLVGLLLYGLVAVGMFLDDYMRLGWYSVTSPIILVTYIMLVYKMPKTAEEEVGADEGMPLKTAVIRFSICAVVLIGVSILMTYLTDIVADKLELGKTFAGALFLGVATSLPELISSVTLCYRGNFNAAAGNIIGSNMFNLAILTVADMLSFGSASHVYVLNAESFWLLVFGFAATISTLAVQLIKRRKQFIGIGATVGVQALNALPPILYLLFLLLTTGVIPI